MSFKYIGNDLTTSGFFNPFTLGSGPSLIGQYNDIAKSFLLITCQSCGQDAVPCWVGSLGFFQNLFEDYIFINFAIVDI